MAATPNPIRRMKKRLDRERAGSWGWMLRTHKTRKSSDRANRVFHKYMAGLHDQWMFLGQLKAREDYVPVSNG